MGTGKTGIQTKCLFRRDPEDHIRDRKRPSLFIPYLRASKIIALIPNETIEKNVERLLFVETNRMRAKRIPIALLPKRVIQGMVMPNTQFDHVPFTYCI